MENKANTFDYRAGIHRLVDKITDRKLLITIYNFINRYYKGRG